MYVVVQLYLSVRAHSPLSQCQLHQCMYIIAFPLCCITDNALRSYFAELSADSERPRAHQSRIQRASRYRCVFQQHRTNRTKLHSKWQRATVPRLIHRKHLSAPYIFRQEHRTDSFAFRCVDDNKFRKIICTKLFLEICGNLL